jgi:hypothetical protein
MYSKLSHSPMSSRFHRGGSAMAPAERFGE